MAATHGKDTRFSVDDSGGTLRAITFVTEVQGLPGARDLAEITAMGDAGVKSIPGLQNAEFTVNGYFDSAATTGSATVLNGIRTATATSTFNYGPEGSTTGKVLLSGEAWLSSLTYDASVDQAVAFSATFRVDGAVTIGTYP